MPTPMLLNGSALNDSASCPAFPDGGGGHWGGCKPPRSPINASPSNYNCVRSGSPSGVSGLLAGDLRRIAKGMRASSSGPKAPFSKDWQNRGFSQPIERAQPQLRSTPALGDEAALSADHTYGDRDYDDQLESLQVERVPKTRSPSDRAQTNHVDRGHGERGHGDRGSSHSSHSSQMPQASAESLLGVARVAVHQQVAPLAERLNSAVTQLQLGRETDSRRLTQLEQQLQTRLEKESATGDRERTLSEVQGGLHGLMEEVKDLTHRVAGLDERLYARTNGADALKQRSRELEQQLQQLEHQGRLAAAAAEDLQRRQVARQRKAEHDMEELTRRVESTEERVAYFVEEELKNILSNLDLESSSALEPRVTGLEQAIKRAEASVRAVQVQVLDGIQAATAANEAASKQQAPADGGHAEGAVASAVERAVAGVERQLSAQVQELASSLASLKVKVAGQGQRVDSLAGRIESAHERPIEDFRAEIQQARQQDHRRWERELADVKGRLGDATEHDVGDKLRQLHERVDVEVGQLREVFLGTGVRPSSSREVLRSSLEAQQDHENLRRAVERLVNDGEHMRRALGEIEAKVEAVLLGDNGQQRTLTPQGAAHTDDPHATSAIRCESEDEDDAEMMGGDDGQSYVPNHHNPQLANGEVQLDREGEEGWTTCMVADDEHSSGRMLEQEFGVLAERLQAVDGLAERLGKLENILSGFPGGPAAAHEDDLPGYLLPATTGSAGSSDDEGPCAPGAGLATSPAQLHSLSREVSELQARLLQSQFALQTAHAPNGFEHTANGAAGENGHAMADITPREEEIVALAERIAEAEHEVFGCSRPGSSPSSTGSLTPYADGPHVRVPDSVHSLSVLERQLAMLEDVFRHFAGQMAMAGDKAADGMHPDQGQHYPGDFHGEAVMLHDDVPMVPPGGGFQSRDFRAEAADGLRVGQGQGARGDVVLSSGRACADDEFAGVPLPPPSGFQNWPYLRFA